MDMPGSIRREGVVARRFFVTEAVRALLALPVGTAVRMRRLTTLDPDLSCQAVRQRFSVRLPGSCSQRAVCVICAERKSRSGVARRKFHE